MAFPFDTVSFYRKTVLCRPFTFKRLVDKSTGTAGNPVSEPKKQAKAKRFKEKLWYPTGWYFDEKTGLWTAPDYINKEANTRWTWDEEKKIWIDKTK